MLKKPVIYNTIFKFRTNKKRKVSNTATVWPQATQTILSQCNTRINTMVVTNEWGKKGKDSLWMFLIT